MASPLKYGGGRAAILYRLSVPIGGVGFPSQMNGVSTHHQISPFSRTTPGAQNALLPLFFFITLYYSFREIRAALPRQEYSSRKSSATQSYKCMLGLFVFP